jgi:hypothetical protein
MKRIYFALVLSALIAVTSARSEVWVHTNLPSASSTGMSADGAVVVATVASSADGRRLLAAGADKIYLSTDFGATWSSQIGANPDAMSSASSADGTRLGLASYFGIYISTNSGLSWELSNQQALAWDSVACSADGHRWWASRGAGLYGGTSAAAPFVQFNRTNENVSLSWIVPSSPFVLQQRAFVDGGVWSGLSVTPKMNPSTLCDEVLIPATDASRFFRLASP